MKPIRILSPELDLLAEIDDYESLSLGRGYYAPASFELTINRHKQNTEYLEKDNIIIPAGELHKPYIIRHKEMELDESGKLSENWFIIGNELGKVANRRIIAPPDNEEFNEIEDIHEKVMRQYVSDCFIEPEDNNRIVEQLSLGELKDLGTTEKWRARFEFLDDKLESIARNGELGWRISLDYDASEWVFEVYRGVDRTVDNEQGNEPVILSPEYDSIKQLIYTDSDLEFKNFGFVGGDGEGAERLIAEVEEGSPTGLDRRETFINESSIESESELISEGQRELKEIRVEKTLEGSLLEKAPFQYETDFDLGDKITIQNHSWGLRMDTRLIEITENYSRDGLDLEAVFGSKRLMFTDVFDKEIKDFKREVRR